MIHSDVTEKKLIEVQKALNYDEMVILLNLNMSRDVCHYTQYVVLIFHLGQDVDNVEPLSKSNHQEIHPVGERASRSSLCL